MKSYIVILLLSTCISLAQTTRTTIAGQVIEDNPGRLNYYQVPSYGYVQRVYSQGAWGYYVNGLPLDYNFFGSLKTITSTSTFDLGKIGQPGRVETAQKFAAIWQVFRESYTLNEKGKFIYNPGSKTPANKLTLNEFAHYANESRPTIELNFIEKCNRCDGRRMRTGITQTGAVGEVPCEDCNAHGSKAKKETYSLYFSGQLPERPKLDDFIKEGLVAAPKSEPVAMVLKPMPTPAPTPEAAPAPRPSPEAAPAPRSTSEAVTKELTPEERFQATKSRAQAGDSQSQYELGLYYAQRHERVTPLDYFEAYSWTLKASQKNHALAQNHLARMHETGRGTERNLEQAIKWNRSAALLGCKQSQRWMGQIYYSSFIGNSVYQDHISNDISNLTEAYAWFLLGSERTIESLPSSDSQQAVKDMKLNSRDYSFEFSTQSACESERDNVAKNPSFTKKISDAAKARFNSLKEESLEYRKANPSK